MIETLVYEPPGPTLLFERSAPGGAHQSLSFATAALTGIDGFQPSAVELVCRPDETDDHVFAGLVAQSAAPLADWSYLDLDVTETTRVDARALGWWARRLIEPEARWFELHVVASRTRLPDRDDEWFTILPSGHRRRVVVDREVGRSWVTAPRDRLLETAPLDVDVTSALGAVWLSIGVRWSEFAQPGAAGRAWLGGVVDRLVGAGWTLARQPQDWNQPGPWRSPAPAVQARHG